MKKLASVVSVFAAGIFLAGNVASAQQRGRDQSAGLQGITAVNVYVSILGNVDNVAARRMLENKLREKKIRIGTTEPSSLELICATMDMPIGTTTPSTCTLRLMQTVTRSFPSPVTILAPIWQTQPNIQNYSKADFAIGFTNSMETLIDSFIDDWAKVNKP